MSLVYKSSVRENITDLQTYIVDTTPTSTKYFRVSDVPQVLQKGKNLLRITAHPTNLVPGSQVYVDVRDSNGNAIYYEIPDYLEDDKSRVISIWVYHDKGDDNTPNGQATITLAGTANVDENGQPLPERHRGKINVKWQAVVTVDRDRSNTSEIIFNSTNLPNLSVSQSIESYQNQAQSNSELLQTVVTGKASYIKSGFSPIIQTTDGSTFNSEMIGASVVLSNYSEPATPETTIANPLSSTFYSASISGLLNSTAAQVTPAYTSSFQNRPDVIHTYQNISEADYRITYVQSGSNVTTENFRNFVTLTFSNVDPIAGLVDKVKILQKSDGLPGDYELLNEVTVPFSSSFEVKVPIPSKNLNDPKVLKLQYLNSVGSISRTETITNPFIFEGDNVYIGGNQNMISGSIFVSNTVGTGIEIGGASSGFMRSVGFEGLEAAKAGTDPGGFIIYSGSGNLQVGAGEALPGVGMQFVGDNDDRHLIFTTANGGLLDVKTDKFFIGTQDSQFISGSDSNIEISSSLFHLDPKNESLIIGAGTTILADLSVNQLFTPAQINGQQSNITNASSSITSDGFAKFVSASIGGWDVTTSSIEGSNLIMKPEGILQTRDYIKDNKGWIISSEDNGFAEFENIKIRGTLATTTFEKESVNAVGGQLYVANSTTLSGSFSSSVDVTLSSFVTSSTTLPSDFGTGDILDVGGTEYIVSSIKDTTKFRLTTAQRFDDAAATLMYSSSNSITPNITAFESTNTITNTANSASVENTNKLTLGQTVFEITNYQAITPSGVSIQVFQNNSSSIVSEETLFRFSGKETTTAGGIVNFNKATNKYTYLLQSGYDISGNADAGNVLNMSFLSSSTATTYDSSETITRSSGGWLPVAYNSNDDGEITFNDGSGNRTYSVKQRINGTTLLVNTSSYAPNTSGSVVAATLEYSSSNEDSVTVNAGTTETVEQRFPNVSPSASVFIVQNVSGFAQNEILTLKKVTNTGFTTEYVKVDSTERFDAGNDTDFSGKLIVTRSYGSGTTGDSGSLGDIASSAQSYEEGQVIVSTGKIGSGYIRINANPNDSSTPYIDIVERTGSGLYDVELKARLGDLSGLDGTAMVLNKTNPGFGLATDNVYLQGGISATFGDIAGFGITSTAISSSNGDLELKANGQMTGSFMKIKGGDIGGFTIEQSTIFSANDKLRLKADGSMTGSQMQIKGGVIGGFDINSNRIESSNQNLILRQSGEVTGSSVLFDGGTIGGLKITSETLETTTLLASPDNSPAAEISASGVISGSDLYIRKVVDVGNGDEVYPLIDTRNGLLDGRNLGRQVVADYNEYYRSNVNDDSNEYFDVASWIFHLLPYEDTLSISMMLTTFSDTTSYRVQGQARLALDRLAVSGSSEIYSATLGTSPNDTATEEDGWTEVTVNAMGSNLSATTSGTDSSKLVSTRIASRNDSRTYSVPTEAQAGLVRVRLQMQCDGVGGSYVSSEDRGVRVTGVSVIATRALSASTMGSPALDIGGGAAAATE